MSVLSKSRKVALNGSSGVIFQCPKRRCFDASWCQWIFMVHVTVHMQTMRTPISLTSHPHNDEIKLPPHVYPSHHPVLMLTDHSTLVHASSCLFHRGWGLVLPSKQRLPESHINTLTDVLLQTVSASLSLPLSHSCWNRTISGMNTDGKPDKAEGIHLVRWGRC